MTTGDGHLGHVEVTIGARDVGLSSTLDQATANVEQATQAIDQATLQAATQTTGRLASLGSSFVALGQKVSEATKPVRQFLGAFVGIGTVVGVAAGAITGLVNSVRLLSDRLILGSKQAREYADSMKAIASEARKAAESRVFEFQSSTLPDEQRQRLAIERSAEQQRRDVLQREREELSRAVFEDTKQRIRDETAAHLRDIEIRKDAELRAHHEMLAERARIDNEDAAAKRREEEQARASEIDKEAQEARRALLSEEERAREEYRSRDLALEREHANAVTDELRKAIQERRRVLYQEHVENMEQIQERADAERRANEQRDEHHRQELRRMANELRAAREQEMSQERQILHAIRTSVEQLATRMQRDVNVRNRG